MIKLYKRLPGGKLGYREAWTHGRRITEHWGLVGERGETAEHKRPPKTKEDAALEGVLAAARADGFAELEDVATLLVEYQLGSGLKTEMGTAADVDKRHALEGRMNELLGWTGLGHCDGGSIGSGTMEVCCFVVDFELARQVIAADLKGTPFGDYTRIYDENA